MALVIADRVKETTTTTGTGTINLAGAASGFQSFVSGIGDGNTTYYAITDANGAWEVGLGTVTDASPDTLARTTILANSNGDTSAITLSSGTHTVFATYPAGKAVYLDASGNLSHTVDISSDTNLAAGTGITLTGDTLSTTDGEIVHDNLSGFVANEHIDWTTDQGSTNIHAGNYTDTNTMGSGFTVSATTDTTATTITEGEDLFFAAGTGITCETTADGTVTISCTVTDTNTTYTKASFDLDHLFTLVGASADTDENLGTFTGSTIADNQTIKAAIQAVETAVETKGAVAGSSSIVTVGTISSGTWQGTAIAQAYIANDAINGDKIADDAVDSEHYAAGSIDEEHLNATNSPTDNYLLSYDDASGGFTWVAAGSGGENNEYSFKTISVAGQDDVVADTTTDTLTFAAGSNVTITTTAASDTITIAATDTNTMGSGFTVSATTDSNATTITQGDDLFFAAGTGITCETTADGTVTISCTVTDTNTQLSTEQVQDIVGGMVTGNTETGITVTYEDGDGTLDFVVGTLNQDTTGNAATATALETARTINGTSFDGTANITITAAGSTLSDTVTVEKGGTGATSLTDGGVLLGSGTGAITATAVLANGELLIGDNSTDPTVATLTAGSNISITNGAGSITIAATDTNTQLTTEQVQDIAGGMFSSNTETLITATYQDADGTIDLVVDNDLSNYDNSSSGFITATLTTEQVQDIVGGMVTGNTETGITVTYEDGDGTLDFVVGTLNQDTTGNAATATALETARTINGTSFDGTGNITITAAGSTLSDTVTVAKGGTGATSLTDGGVLLGSGTDAITATAVLGNGQLLIGDNSTDPAVATLTEGSNVTITNGAGTITIAASDTNTQLSTEQVQDIVGGMVTGNTETGISVTYEDGDGTLDFVVGTLNQDTTGNAATATALETARTINGTSFDGTANITVTAAGSTLSDTVTVAKGGTGQTTFTNGQLLIGNTTGNTLTKSTLTAGSNVTITNGTGSITIAADNDNTQLSEEQVEDFVGGMVTGNTETGISVTYEDGDGTLDFVVSDTTVAGDSGSTGITPGDTLTIAGGTNATTAMSGDTLTVNVDDAFLKNNADDTTSGTVTMANLIVGDAGNIGSASDTDAIAIASDGEVTLSQRTTFSKAVKTPLKSNTDGATITFDLDEASTHTVTLGDNRTLAISNEDAGQKFIINLVQDGTGSRTVTWFSTIKWAGGSAPTLTTTADKADSFGFLCTGSDAYYGFVIGQNI